MSGPVERISSSALRPRTWPLPPLKTSSRLRQQFNTSGAKAPSQHDRVDACRIGTGHLAKLTSQDFQPFPRDAIDCTRERGCKLREWAAYPAGPNKREGTSGRTGALLTQTAPVTVSLWHSKRVCVRQPLRAAPEKQSAVTKAGLRLSAHLLQRDGSHVAEEPSQRLGLAWLEFRRMCGQGFPQQGIGQPKRLPTMICKADIHPFRHARSASLLQATYCVPKATFPVHCTSEPEL